MRTTKTNHSESLINLRADLLVATRKREVAREAWLANRNVVTKSVEDALYEEYHSYGRQIDRLADEIQFHTIMMQDKKYATEWLWSDAHAYEVIEEKSDKLIWVRRMKATIKPEAKKALHDSFVPGGFCGHFDNELQEWEFVSDETQPIEAIRRHKDGRWYNGSRHFTIEAQPYERYDYNF